MSDFESFLNHPIETLEKALHLRKRIAELEEVLREVFGPTPPSLGGIQTTDPVTKGKRTMSPAARARIAEAQKLRWAKSKGFEAAPAAAPAKAPVTTTAKAAAKPTPEAKRKKGGMSAEGRARIVAAQKARWARVKGEKATPAPAKAVPKKKRNLSPEARARIVAAVKARWANTKKK